MNEHATTPPAGGYEWPSPLRVPGRLHETAPVFAEALAALAPTGADALARGLRARPAAAPDDPAPDPASDPASDPAGDPAGDAGTAAVGNPADAPPTRVFPADRWQLRAAVQALARAPGTRIVYTSRGAVPDLTDVNDELMFATDYQFAAGRDDLIREGADGWLVSYGDALGTCLDVVDRLLADGISIGLVGKPWLDAPDAAMLARLAPAPAVLLVETLADPHGIGPRLRDWLASAGFTGAFARLTPHALEPDRSPLPDAGRILAALRRLLAPRALAPTARALTREELRARAVRCVELDDPAAGPERVELPPPKVLGALDHRLAAKLGPFTFQPPFAAELHDLRLVGPTALAVTADGRPILETAANRIDVLGRSLARLPGPLDRVLAAGSGGAALPLACSLVDLWSPLYAHWLLEGLTRLQGWEAYCEATGERPVLIIPSAPPTWMRESLRLLGVAPDDCLEWPGRLQAVDRLVVCSRRRERGRVSARALDWVRGRTLAALPAAPSPGPRRIFITRDDSRFRQVRNEDAVMDALAPLGFARVRLSALPWAEQVRLFRDVEAVVAAHGAGMTNILFATRRPLVVELFGQKVSHMNYTVGLGTGCDHRVLACTPDGDDLIVDPAALRRLLDA